MSLGLPVHLVPYHVRRASAKASHVVALVSIVTAALLLLAIQTSIPEVILWPALLPMAILLALLWLLNSRPTLLFTSAYVLVGAACVYWVCIVAMTQFPGAQLSNNFVLSLVKVALVMVGGVGVGATSAVAWTAVGLFAAGIATHIAAIQTGSTFILDGTPIAAAIVVAIIHIAFATSRHTLRAAQPSLHRAERDEHISAVRYRIEAKAAAVMHDTVLNHLAAIAAAPAGELPRALRTQIDRDLEILVGEEWLLDTEGPADQEHHVEWRNGRLFKVIEESRQLGLEVEVSGELATLAVLGAEQTAAVSLAVKQCLVNVSKHAQTDRAEVVVYGSPDEVCVMVIDAGVGFSEKNTDADRLGLRQSVRRRIEAVGGSVQVWSTVGKGTSVMIRVPASQSAVGEQS